MHTALVIIWIGTYVKNSVKQDTQNRCTYLYTYPSIAILRRKEQNNEVGSQNNTYR